MPKRTLFHKKFKQLSERNKERYYNGTLKDPVLVKKVMDLITLCPNYILNIYQQF